MTTIIFANFFVFVIVSAICIYKGLDLKKQSSWLYGLYGFFSGFLIGFLRSDGDGGYYFVTNLPGSFQAGTLFAFVVMIGGASTRWNKNLAQKYGPLAEKYLKDLSERKSDKSK